MIRRRRGPGKTTRRGEIGQGRGGKIRVTKMFQRKGGKMVGWINRKGRKSLGKERGKG